MSKENDRAALGLDLSVCAAIAQDTAHRTTRYRIALAMEWLGELAAAAFKYSTLEHIFDSQCSSHPSDCEACAARKDLERVIGARL